jgi:hypothetical protein
MSSSASHVLTPSLVEVIKSLARDWTERVRACNRAYEEWRRMPFDEEKEPARQRLEGLESQYWEHPITRLFVLIEEHGGPSRDKCEEVAQRINTTIGLREYKRPLGAPGDGQHDWPDLLWVARELNKLDADGTTARVLAAFERRHPEMASLYRLDRDASANGEPAVQEPQIEHKPRMSKESADKTARGLAAREPEFKKATSREWAKRIGCSTGLVSKLPLWIELHPEPRQKRGGRPKAVGLTSKVEASVGSRDEELDRLVKEQLADAEPSPLDDSPGPRCRVQFYKRA